MELDPALLTEFKTLRLHPLIQRRELMFGMALAASNQMPDEERSHDKGHAEMLALARAQFIEALTEKGMQPDAAEHVVQHVENQSTQVSSMMLELVSSLATIRRTSERRASLPVHMQGLPNFVTQLRMDNGLEAFLGEQAKDYAPMIRVLAPSHYTRDRNAVIGELKKDNVVLQFSGTQAVAQAEQMKAVLNALKEKLGIKGLFAGMRTDEPNRGTIYGACVNVEPEMIKALVTAFVENPALFKETLESLPATGRAVG